MKKLSIALIFLAIIACDIDNTGGANEGNYCASVGAIYLFTGYEPQPIDYIDDIFFDLKSATKNINLSIKDGFDLEYVQNALSSDNKRVVIRYKTGPDMWHFEALYTVDQAINKNISHTYVAAVNK